MGTARSIIKNSSLLFLARVANLAATFAIGLYLARFSGVASYGEFSFVMTYFFIFSTISSLGLGTITSREVAKHPERLGGYFHDAGAIAFVSSLIGLIVMVSVSFCFDLSREGRSGFYLLTLSLIPSTLIYLWESLLITVEKNGTIIVVQSVEAFLKVVLAYLVLESGFGLVGLMAVFLATRLLAAGLYLPVLRRVVKGAPAGVGSTSVQLILSSVPTFAALYIFSVLFSKIDLVMLSLLKDFHDVGIYGAAYKLLEISFLLPTCVVTVIFPVLSRCASEAPETIGRTSRRAALYSALAFVPVVIGALIFADKIVYLLFPKEFAASVLPFRILIVTLGLYMVDQIFAHTLVAMNYQNTNLKVLISGTLVNIAVNLALIPRYSYLGASVATLVSMTFVACAHCYWVNKLVVGSQVLEASAV